MFNIEKTLKKMLKDIKVPQLRRTNLELHNLRWLQRNLRFFWDPANGVHTSDIDHALELTEKLIVKAKRKEALEKRNV